jgi:hypothetical protein
VSADRSGRCSGAFTFGITKVRVGAIIIDTQKAGPRWRPAKPVSSATYTQLTHQMQPPRNCRQSRFGAVFCATNLPCGSVSRHLCPLGLVWYQRGHGTSVKPTTRGFNAHGHAAAQLRVRRFARLRPRRTLRRRQRTVAAAANVDVRPHR